jgi:alanyl-tRNA synthetase
MLIPFFRVMKDQTSLPLYWSAPYQKEILTKVTSVKGKELQFEENLFYPTGGGQLADTGILRYLDNEYPVYDVYKAEDGIWHKIDAKDEITFQNGQEVFLKLDWEKRYSYMQAHTAQHLVSHLLKQMYGCETEKANFEENRFEIEISDSKDNIEMLEVLKKANDMIYHGDEVKAIIVDQETYRNEYQKRARGKESDEPYVRMIQIGEDKGYDLTCCGGVHIKNLSEIKGIVLESNKNRFSKFLIGRKAFFYANQQRKIMIDIEDITEKKGEKLIETVYNKISESDILKDGNINLLRIVFRNIINLSEKIGHYNLTHLSLPEIDRQIILSSVKELVQDNFVAIHGRNDILYLISSDEKLLANEIAKTMMEKTKTKGGGNKGFAQLSVKDIEEPLEIVKSILKSL